MSVTHPTTTASEVITFTSGGTEANYTAMHWAIEAYKACHDDQAEIPHVITSNIEHCATELPLKKWQQAGQIQVDFIPVQNGQIQAKSVMQAIKTNTCLITIMLANNETGVLQPLAEIVSLVKSLNEERQASGNLCPILIHSDTAQAFGKIPVSIHDDNLMGIDYMTIVGHKFYGPRIGAIYHRQGTVEFSSKDS